MISYHIESYETLIDEIFPLLEAHFKEVVKFKDQVTMQPNHNLYSVAEENGYFFIYTARDDDRLIGYAGFFLQPAPHYKEVLHAVNDVLYIKEEYRGTDAARSLLKFAEQDLKELGASIISLALTKESSFPTSLGYELEEYKYSKYIGDNNG